MLFSDWKERHEQAPWVHQEIILQDTCPAMIVQFCGLLGAAAANDTAATIALVQGSSMTWLVATDVPAGIDDIGTSGVIDTGTSDYDTVGELVNSINKVGGGHRAICLVPPETPSANLFAKSAASCITDGGLVFYLDSSVIDTTYLHTLPITGSAFVDNGISGFKTEESVINYLHYGQMTSDFGSTETFTVKMWKAGDTQSTTLFTQAMEDNVLTNIGNTSQPSVPFIASRMGYMLCCEWRSDASFDTDPTVCNIMGKSVVTDGSREVSAVPYL